MHGYDFGSVVNEGYWRVAIELATLATTLTDIVTPASAFEGPDTIGGQPSVFRDPGLVVRGFAYSFNAASSGIGFDLVFRNNQGTPGSDETQWEARTGADGLCQFASNDIVWPLRRPVDQGGGSYLSGILAAQRIGAITSGYLQIWGTHGLGDSFGTHAFGSPTIQY